MAAEKIEGGFIVTVFSREDILYDDPDGAPNYNVDHIVSSIHALHCGNCIYQYYYASVDDGEALREMIPAERHHLIDSDIICVKAEILNLRASGHAKKWRRDPPSCSLGKWIVKLTKKETSLMGYEELIMHFHKQRKAMYVANICEPIGTGRPTGDD